MVRVSGEVANATFVCMSHLVDVEVDVIVVRRVIVECWAERQLQAELSAESGY